MKTLILLSLTFICAQCFSQSDTICTKSGQFYIGQKISTTPDSITIMLLDSSTKTIATSNMMLCDDLMMRRIKYSLEYAHFKPITPKIDEAEWQRQRTAASVHLKRAGRFGISGITLMIGGGIISTVCAIKGKTNGIYVGSAIAGAGFVLQYGTFANLIKAGRAVRAKNF